MPGASPDNFTLKGEEFSSDYRKIIKSNQIKNMETSALVLSEVHKPVIVNIHFNLPGGTCFFR